MYQTTIKILAVLALLLAPCSLLAQQGNAPAVITGRIIDSVGRQPLDYVTIMVMDSEGNALSSGYSETDGSFKLALPKTGPLRVLYSLVGYAQKVVNVANSTQQKLLDLKDVYLTSTTKNLNEVSITAQRRLVVQKPGMLVYNAGNDPANKGGTAADVLRKAPVLNVDARGNVTMRGSGNIKILVDGKYSGQMARSPADALNMMPADIIQSVEVITTPSAKYDAEGAAGVINIITKKGRKQLSGAIEAAAGNWEQVINPRLSWVTGKWNINANAHLHRLRMKSTKDYERVNILNGVPASQLNQGVVQDNTAPHGSATVNADYTIDSLNVLTLGITSWFGNWPDNSRLSSRVSQPDGMITEQYQQAINSYGRYLGADFNLGYTHKFKAPGRELVLLAQVSPSKDHARYTADQTSTQNELLYREQNDSRTHNREWTFQLDYLHPFDGNKYSLETGAKYISRNVSSNYQAEGTKGQQLDLIPLPDRTNIFDYSQKVLAGYVIFKANLPAGLYAEAGARVERTMLAGNFVSGGNAFQTSFTNVVPTATLSKKISEVQQLSLSYTKRLTRPYIWDLNPNINAADPKNLVTGNPQLQPEFAHQAELSYSVSLNSGISLNPAFFWRQTNNSIESLTTTDASGISTTSKQNLATNRQYGFNLSASIPLHKKWSLNTNANVNNADFNSTALQIISKGWAAELNINSTYKLPQNISLQASGAYNTRTILLQGYRSLNYYYSFAAKKEFTARKITLTLATVNPFTQAVRQTQQTSASSFTANSINREYNQSVKLTLGWEFGKLFKQAESKRIQNDDVKSQGKG